MAAASKPNKNQLRRAKKKAEKAQKSQVCPYMHHTSKTN